MEEVEGYLTGDSDPFIMESSEDAMVVCPVEEREESVDLPTLEERVESTEVFKEDKLEMLLTGESLGTAESDETADPRAVLKGRFELYML